MILKHISIYRRARNYSGATGPTDPFDATVAIEGEYGEVKLKLRPDLCQRVVAVLADEIVAAARETAEAMTAQALEVAPTPTIEGVTA